ncbi:glutamine--fructose-6-phosphate transaminase (isomerizing) [Verrucomicrobiaceae bacterium N1E253]|uniref:Glutamine--fructose-6-phosphate aminotransferase [isomerizing] n=1 Tax=Oceaniferula marina TaxID=2748318 RepID=A0A851GD89_9BACT|nr:glutamine--fructose-6-phosphate transaminase (isomerizing) [Oceaniferula marina]NWK55376.1 glutamine--fructose-6-phosphate transaminase (isomerizing) [Oceaniferula marina]
MCGIVGYTGKRAAMPVLISGLKKLEYRGYDSAGVALASNEEIFIRKQSGKVSGLSELIEQDEQLSRLNQAKSGIAHTRWATHGPPTTDNAHPHQGPKRKIALVHNGIIENHNALRDRLKAEGNSFSSQTDSEVLAHLIEHHYNGEDLLGAVTAALKEVEGTFGITCMAVDRPGVLIVARRGSPIVIGLGKDETIIASDASAIITHTRQAIYLDDDDIARIEGSQVDIRSLGAGTVTRTPAEIDWSPDAAEKGGYEHYMLKEVFEQPEAIRNTIRGRIDTTRGTAILSGLNLSPRELVDIRRLLVVGCGTSMNAGLIGEYAVEDFAGIPAEVEQAAEFRYRNPIVGSRDMVLAISQSGETADTLAAVREAVDKGSLVAALVNVVGSTIARETGRGIYLHAGPEISVASTKAFTSQVSVLLMVALKLARAHRLSRENGIQIARAIEAIPSLVEAVLANNDEIAKVAAEYAHYDNAFYIGRGYMYPVALEGALKLKEISYIHAEGYHSAELKHGPIALLEESMPVIALLNNGPGQDKSLGNVAECKARSAPVLGVITKGNEEARKACDHVIEIPECPHYTAVIPAAVALQLFAYHVARIRGCAIDQPRNLAKSVTVE